MMPPTEVRAGARAFQGNITVLSHLKKRSRVYCSEISKDSFMHNMKFSSCYKRFEAFLSGKYLFLIIIKFLKIKS